MEAGTVLATAFSALLGAWAGAAVALTRFQKERAFERRLQWYEEMQATLRTSRDELLDSLQSLRQVDEPTAHQQQWLNLCTTVLDRLSGAMERAAFYASAETVHKLQALEIAMKEFSAGMQKRAVRTDHPGTEQFPLVAEFCAELQRASGALVVDVRKDLGLDRLREA